MPGAERLGAVTGVTWFGEVTTNALLWNVPACTSRLHLELLLICWRSLIQRRQQTHTEYGIVYETGALLVEHTHWHFHD